MPSSSPILQWLRNPPHNWHFHLMVTLVVFVVTSGALTLHIIPHDLTLSGHYTLWSVPQITMVMFFVWGHRSIPGVLCGSFIAFLPWYHWQLSLIAAGDGVVQASIGIWLVRKFWPKSMQPQPSVRFFALLIGLGVMLPGSIVSLPTVWAFHSKMYFSTDFWTSYMEWCINELSGSLILLPGLLMLIYPSFRKTVEHPRELAAYISLGIGLMIFGVLHALDSGSNQVMQIESWMLVGAAGFIMSLRNGVGGIIIANLVLALAATIVRMYLANSDVAWITPRMLIEFNIYACYLIGLSLVVAAGFHDHKMMHNISRSITAQMLHVQISERRRLAADLHDSVSQEFAAALMHLHSGVSQIPVEKRNENIKLAEACLHKGLQDLRRTAAGLRPELLEHGKFVNVIESYCASFEERHGIDVLFENDADNNDNRLSLEQREHTFRIIQEALNNAVSHGKAKVITVTLSSTPKKIVVRIEDDGIGFSPQMENTNTDRPHLGLRLMQERAIMIGGTFNITSARGRGTTLQVTIPFDNTIAKTETSPTPNAAGTSAI